MTGNNDRHNEVTDITRSHSESDNEIMRGSRLMKAKMISMKVWENMQHQLLCTVPTSAKREGE